MASAVASVAVSTVGVASNDALRRRIYNDWLNTWFKRVNLASIAVVCTSLLVFAWRDTRVRTAVEKAILAMLVVFFTRTDQVFAPFWAMFGLSYILGL